MTTQTADFETSRFAAATHHVIDGAVGYWVAMPGASEVQVIEAFAANYRDENGKRCALPDSVRVEEIATED